jgi:hypothetical protein
MTYPESDIIRFVGAWEGITSRYTVIDQHGSGLTVVWSWSSDGDIPAVVDDLVASIIF